MKGFSIGFAVALGLQSDCLFLASMFMGDASRFIAIFYRPFNALGELLIEHHYFGRSEGSLAYYAVATVAFGMFIYSIIAGFMLAWFTKKGGP